MKEKKGGGSKDIYTQHSPPYYDDIHIHTPSMSAFVFCFLWISQIAVLCPLGWPPTHKCGQCVDATGTTGKTLVSQVRTFIATVCTRLSFCAAELLDILSILGSDACR